MYKIIFLYLHNEKVTSNVTKESEVNSMHSNSGHLDRWNIL